MKFINNISFLFTCPKTAFSLRQISWSRFICYLFPVFDRDNAFDTNVYKNMVDYNWSKKFSKILTKTFDFCRKINKEHFFNKNQGWGVLVASSELSLSQWYVPWAKGTGGVNVLDVVSDEVIEIHYETMKIPLKSNVVIAASTTAYACLKLYEALDLLQERAFYYDTDSMIFVSKPGDPVPPTGPYLAELTVELKGDYITTFNLGEPKNYCYCAKSNKVETNAVSRWIVPLDKISTLRLFALWCTFMRSVISQSMYPRKSHLRLLATSKQKTLRLNAWKRTTE